MPFKSTPLPGLWIFEPKIFQDSRGYFFENYNKREFQEAGIETEFVQDNQSKSKYGVVRGLHFQEEPYAQAKLVRVLEGEVLDVVVDIRSGSPTYGLSYSLVLTADNFVQLYIPRGFAHGFAVLSEEAVFSYKCDNYYSKDHDAGIYYNDPQLSIDWMIPPDKMTLSEKDKHLPLLKDVTIGFEYKNQL